MMKILYVTPFWTSLKDVVNSNSMNTGMPAFILPLTKLTEMGYAIDFIFISDFEIQQVLKDSKSDLINEENTVGIIRFQKRRRFRKWFESFCLSHKLRGIVKKAILEKQYDFVYGHSEYALAALKLARKEGISCALRMYGTFVYRDYEAKGFLRTLFARPLEILAYNTSYDFILMTNDGTDGDKAYQKFAIQKNTQFCFWMNGIDHLDSPQEDQLKYVTEKFSIKNESIFYLARVTKWKGQEKAIEVIAELFKHGIKKHIYFAGQISENDESYFQNLLRIAREEGIIDYVHFIGTVDRHESNAIARICKYSLVMYEGSCLGNVFHELLSSKALLICLDEHNSLAGIIDNGINGYAVHTMEDVINTINILDKDIELCNRIRENAGITSRQMMKTWDARISDEIELITGKIEKACIDCMR